MKKITFMIGMLVLLIVPNAAFAHTHMTSSNPEEGSTVEKPIKEVVLTFDTKIESLSTITLKKDGSEIPLEVAAEGDTLKGTASNDLENGAYTADWKIVGEDGHEMEGTLSFKVQQEVEEEEPQTTNENEAAENNDSNDQSASEEDKKTEQTDEQSESTETEKSNNNSAMTITLVAIGVLAAAGIVFLMKKKG